MNASFIHLVVRLAAVAGLNTTAVAQAETPPATVQDGVYSSAQLMRGTQHYQQHCQSCHAADMNGGPAARGLTGMAFQYLWKDKTLAELYAAMREKMPPGNPGSLADAEYLDILAAVLQRNGFPAGDSDLPADPAELQQIWMTWEVP